MRALVAASQGSPPAAAARILGDAMGAGMARRGDAFRVRLRRRGSSVSATFATRAEAEAFRALWLAAVDRGEAPPAPPAPPPIALLRAVTVEDACRELVQGMVSGVICTRGGHRFKPSTIRGVENRLRLYVLPRIGAIPITALRRGDVQRFVDELASERTPATTLNVRDALRIVLRRQVDLEVIETNSALGVRAPSVERAPARFLSADEADALQSAADEHANPMIGPFVALALASGLRLGELQALVWGPDGLDLDARAIRVAASRDRAGQIGPTKSRNVRTVPVGGDLAARMMRFPLVSANPPDGERVFPHSHRRAWEHVRAGIGVPELRVHDLRHTCATFLLAAGLKSHEVAGLLGHRDAGLVDRLYGHALPSEMSTAAERFEAWRAAQRS